MIYVTIIISASFFMSIALFKSESESIQKIQLPTKRLEMFLNYFVMCF